MGWVKRLMLGDAHQLATWVCAGHNDPAAQTQVLLHGLDRPLDVSRNHVIVELIPLMVAIMFERADRPRLERRPVSLSLHDPENSGYCLGDIALRFTEAIPVGPDHVLAVFTAGRCRNYCLPGWRMQGYYLYERVKLWFDRDPRNVYKQPPRILFCNWLLFAFPREVTLVSFDDGRHCNMFPMDLIGTTASPYFLLSLSHTDPSLPHLLRHKRLAISSVPMELTPTVYAMGKHHKQAHVAVEDWPLGTRKSDLFGTPVPEQALAVRELEIVATHTLPTHRLIIAETRRVDEPRGGLRMCHVQRSYQQYLLQRQRALASVARGYTR